MTWPLLIATHAFAAAVALTLGAWQLFFSTKGNRQHRLAGRTWVALMLYVSITSFWIRDLRDGAFSFLHVLSVVTVVTVTLGVVGAVRGNIQSHRGNMTGSWIGLLFAFVFAVAIPDRHIPTFVVSEPLQATAAAASVLLMTIAVVGLANALPQLRQERIAS